MDELAGDKARRTALARAPEADQRPRTSRAARGGSSGASLTRRQAAVKRCFDIVASAAGLVLLSPVIAGVFVAATIDTHASGFFRQERIGRHGKPFQVIKIRSMRVDTTIRTSVTTANDPRITRLGRLLRRSKLDELPQLWNVLVGEMSLVGPRPEVPGFADQLTGPEAVVLSVRPGITGPATLFFRNEERLLATAPDPEAYNREILFPSKVRMNVEYIRDYSFRRDLGYLWKTLR